MQVYKAIFFYFKVKPSRCNVAQCIYFCEMLYMLRAEDPPETCRAFHRNKYIVQRCILMVLLENTFTMHVSANVKFYNVIYNY
jgi:hypothetical protein